MVVRYFASTLADSLNAKPLTGSTGSEISTGIELREITDETLAQLTRLVSERCVVALRNQYLSPEELVTLGHRLGNVTYTPGLPRNTQWENVFLVTSPREGGYPTEHWHTDATTQVRPPAYTILIPKSLPDVGGDTLVLNQYETYASLSLGFRKLLSGLTLRHEIRIQAGQAGVVYHDDNDRGGADHPLVRFHPDTGRRCIFINAPGGLGDIDGLSSEESRWLVEYLYRKATADNNRIYRHRWQPGDVLIFDNRCSMHSVVHDYPLNQERTLYRLMTQGEEPYDLPYD